MLFGLSAKDKLATDAACHTSRHLDDLFNASLEAVSLTVTSRKPHSASIRSTVNFAPLSFSKSDDYER
jgi:hypothetical protein